MNASLSDGNEPVIDIFILSANSLLSAQLEKQLREEGYYVTLFADGTHLLETLRNGKPNLLMCDTTSEEVDAFEVCRQIKADEYLWNIPVLILTGAADLGDLLRVLDSNADNFIAFPFDPPYLVSLIEGMLTVPVERQTPEQIKTQFKIKHDDQVYVVTADRRKLLEFLLSSFEIAVNKSADLSRARDDTQNLGTTIRQLEGQVSENTKVISIINENLKAREQKVADLNRQLSDRDLTIREKTEALDQLTRDLAQEQSAVADGKNEIQRIEKERDESLAMSRSSIERLELQVSDLSSEISTVRQALEQADKALAAESGRLKETADALGTTAAQREEAEKALLSLTNDHEQLKIRFATEQNRATATEQELNAVLAAKTRSEEDLTRIIDELKATVAEQAATILKVREESENELVRVREESASVQAGLEGELESERTRLREKEAELVQVREESASEQARLEGELESEGIRLRDAGENLRAVMAAKDQSETALRQSIEEGQQDLLGVQSRLDEAMSRLGEKDQGITRLAKELAEARSARQSLEQELAAVSQGLTEAKTALDGRQQDLTGLQFRLGEKEQETARLNEELADAWSARRSLEQELAAASRGITEAKTALDGRQQDLLGVQSQLDEAMSRLGEKDQGITRLAKELADARSARQSLEQELAAVSQGLTEAKTTLDGRQQDLAGLQSRLGEKEQETARLNEELAEARSARQSLEQELAAASRSLTEAKTALDGREQDLSGLRDQFETATTRIRENDLEIKTLNDNLAAVRSDQEKSEQDLQSVTRALSETKALLEERQQELLGLREKLGSATILLDEKEQAVTALNNELAAARSSRISAEEDLAAVNRALAETKTALESGTQAIASGKEDLARVYAEKEKAETLAQSLSSSLKEFRDQLEQEKYRFRDTESRMNALILQRDRELGELRRVHEDTRTAASSGRTTLEQMRRNLDAATAVRTELEGKNEEAEERLRRIGLELENVSKARDGDRQQIASLAGDLEQVKSNLEEERLRRQESEDQLRDAMSQQQQLEQDLERFVQETRSLHGDLTAERRMLETTRKQKQILEEQVSSLNREKLLAEKAAEDLTAEISQARTALADEWEDHMTDHERLLAAVEKKHAHAAPAPFSGVKKEAEIIKKRSLIVRVPGFPPTEAPASVSVAPEIPVKVPEPVSTDIRSVEDLFEDDEDDKEPAPELPAVSIISEPSAETAREAMDFSASGSSDASEDIFEGSASPPPDTGDEIGTFEEIGTIEEMGTGEPDSLAEPGDEAPEQNISFDRTQWLDLLKWSHHCEELTQDQRNHIVRMGRLIQKGRRLTRKQEEQVIEMMALVQGLGYRFS